MGTRKAGFTLVELLVVMTVIAILGSLVMVAMYTAQESAREAKTRVTITKINNVIMPLYEAYRYRRVPVNVEQVLQARGWANNSRNVARVRLDAMRELQRMEMPDRWSDVTDDESVLPSRPAVSSAYERLFRPPNTPPTEEHQGAECLFLIVSKLGEDGLEFFHETESKDTDEDGVKEFIDAWGRPIRWLRWPVGFRSALQTGNDPDPFDPARIYPTTGQMQPTFAVWPLIYSAGLDEQSDIAITLTPPASYRANNNNPFIAADDGTQIGIQRDFDSDGENWHDNIHNHDLSSRLR